MLELVDISKKYDGFNLSGIDMKVEKGEYFILLGVSGAGKSLLLEIIAGLVRPETGKIRLNGREVTHENIQDRQVGIVFQDYAVFPHLTVRENIIYPLKKKHLGRTGIHDKVSLLARQMNIEHLLHRMPSSLSGGELQRVALARTLALEPDILLLDEPLASLDVQLRSGIRKLLKSIHHAGQTILHVTHDFEEAASLADKIAVLHKGKIIQTGTPEEVLGYPANEFIAQFAGIKNVFNAKVMEPISNIEEKSLKKILVDERVLMVTPCEGGSSHSEIFIRGENIRISSSQPFPETMNCFQGKVMDLFPGMKGIEIQVDIGIQLHAMINKESFDKASCHEGETVWVYIEPEAIRFTGS